MSRHTGRIAVTATCLALSSTLAACGSSSDKATGKATSVAASASASSSQGAASSSSASKSTTATAGAQPSTSGNSTHSGSSAGSSPSGSSSSAGATAADQSAAPGGKTGSANHGPASTSAAATSPAKTSGRAAATQSLSTKVSGKTLTYTYSSHGTQHRLQAADGYSTAYNLPAQATISFGDGSKDDAGESGMGCQPKSGTNPFRVNRTKTHTYAKPGTYKVTVRTQYCGDSGMSTSVSSYTVTVR